MVFLIDLPRIEDGNKRAANQLTGFGEDLCYFLRAQGLDESLVASLRGFDFSETKRMGFVHTMWAAASFALRCYLADDSQRRITSRRYLEANR